jgi:hypothetical protein
MVFIETPIFTKWITSLLSDDEYRGIQNDLSEKPEKGPVIKGGKGLRKLRCQIPGKGKRDMLFAYKKSEAEDLTKEQIKALTKIVEDRLHEKKLF